MMISDRVALALQISISMVLAVALSLWLGWDEPKWAMLAVSVCVLGTGGESLLKGMYRLGGTVVGTSVALLFLSLFTQDRWGYVFALLAWVAFCGWRLTGTRRWYFWMLAGFVVPLMTLYSGFVPKNAFEIVMIRMQQTSLGVIVFTIICSLFFSNRALKSFRATMTERIEALREQLVSVAGGYGPDDHDSDQGKTGNEQKTGTAKLLQFQVLQSHVELQDKLDAASLESMPVLINRNAWAQVVHDLLLIEDKLIDWQLGLQDIVDTETPPPDIPAVLVEIDRRLAAVRDLVAGEETEVMPTPIKVPDEHVHSEDPFHSGALALSMHTLADIEVASQRMLTAARSLTGKGTFQKQNVINRLTLPTSVIPDPDRLIVILRVVTVVFVAFMLVFYVQELPDGGMLVILPTSVGLFLTRAPATPVVPVFIVGLFALLCSSVLYVFILPKLSSYAELGVVLFFYTFLFGWLFYQPKQAPARFMSLVFMSLIINLNDLHQTYNFLNSPNFVTVFCIAMSLLIMSKHFPVRLTPEAAFCRLFTAYSRSAIWLLKEFALERDTPQSWWKRQQRNFHLRQVYRIPGLLVPWIEGLPEDLGRNGTEMKLASFLHELDILARWLDAMTRTHEWGHHKGADRILAVDLQDWLKNVREATDVLKHDPANLEIDRLENRLNKRILLLRESTSRAISEDEKNSPSAQVLDKKALELLKELIIFRGVSRSLLNIARPVQQIDWMRLRETRF